MSGVKDAYVSVRQSQVNAWNSARWRAEQAARESAALMEQQRRIEQRQQADAREFSRQLNLQAQSQRRAMDALSNRLPDAGSLTSPTYTITEPAVPVIAESVLPPRRILKEM